MESKIEDRDQKIFFLLWIILLVLTTIFLDKNIKMSLIFYNMSIVCGVRALLK